MIARQDISELEPAELEAALGAEPYHARQIYRWIYRRHATEFAGMTDLSRTLRAQLAERFKISTPVVRQTDRSVDGTVKLLLGLTDDQQVEAVYLAVNPAMRYPMVLDALATGKHVLVQKPHAVRAAQILEFEKAALLRDQIGDLRKVVVD